MRYAIFSDIHANLEALEAVLAKIDELSQQEPVDEIWFLGDLVGYGPNPNECITKLRERTNVIIAGNHDWAAVGKIDLEDFSPAARISAEWTTRQLTEEHHRFLTDLPERLEFGECTLVHGSPYGPLWEYLTSEILAERSFQYFHTRYCFVGHTHVPIIFQQPDTIANTPTIPLNGVEQNGIHHYVEAGESGGTEQTGESGEAEEMVAAHPVALSTQIAEHAASAYADPATGQPLDEQEADAMLETRAATATSETEPPAEQADISPVAEAETSENDVPSPAEPVAQDDTAETGEIAESGKSDDEHALEAGEAMDVEAEQEEEDAQPVDVPADEDTDAGEETENGEDETGEPATGTILVSSQEELEELLALFNLSQSMVQITNEMSTPPEGPWQAKEDYRAIINAGGVGQPRDGDPRAAFMIYDSERGFEFYRIPYAIEKTQEKIIKAGLPSYLAVRLAYGR